MTKTVATNVWVHDRDEYGNVTGSTYYEAGSEMEDEHVELVDNPAVFGEEEDPDRWFNRAIPTPVGERVLTDRAEGDYVVGDNYDDMTVAQLKEELTKRGLAVSGTKAELTQRLREDDAAAQGPDLDTTQ